MLNAIELGCNTCNNKKCYIKGGNCKGHIRGQEFKQTVLESALRTSSKEVSALLNIFKLKLTPSNNRRGFNLHKGV